MSALVLRRRAPGDPSKDAVELRIAAEACVEGGVEKCALPAGVALQFVAVEEALHALAVSELDDGETGLLFEEAAKT